MLGLGTHMPNASNKERPDDDLRLKSDSKRDTDDVLEELSANIVSTTKTDAWRKEFREFARRLVLTQPELLDRLREKDPRLAVQLEAILWQPTPVEERNHAQFAERMQADVLQMTGLAVKAHTRNKELEASLAEERHGRQRTRQLLLALAMLPILPTVAAFLAKWAGL